MLLEELFLRFTGHGDFLKAGVRDDHGIPVAGGDATHERLALGLLKIDLRRHENVGARVKRQQFGRELAEHVIGHDEQRFPGKAEPLQLHRGGDHDKRLARPDHVGQ